MKTDTTEEEMGASRKQVDAAGDRGATVTPVPGVEWYSLDFLAPPDQERARGLFKADEIDRIGDYEFTYFGEKLLRRVRPELVKTELPAGTVKNPASAGKPAPPQSSGKPEQSKTLRDEREPVVEDGVEIVRRAPRSWFGMSPLNPRKSYAGMEDFAKSLSEQGVIQPLIVRPMGTHPADALFLPRFEIIEGHRRFKGAQIAGLAELPYLLRPMSDQVALEIMLVANLQREDLNPVEEAEGIQGMLALKGADEQPLYTRATLARKISKSEVHLGKMLRLLRLPAKAREAMISGRIGIELGDLIGKQPTEEMRKRFAEEVLKGFGDGPLSKREAIDLARRNYTVELRGSAFDQKDAKLVPVQVKDEERIAGGACGDCPWNTANIGDADGGKPERGTGALCTNPSCFHAKTKAHVAAVKEKALAAGALVIEGEKAKTYVYHDGTPAKENMVRLDQAPGAGDVNTTKKAPTWGKMLAGEASGEIVKSRDAEGNAIRETVKGKINVPVTVVIDERGRAHQLVERKVAIEAAKKNGFADLFTAASSRRSTAAGGKADEAEAQRKAQENEQKRLRSATSVAALEELVAEIARRGVDGTTWVAMLDLALFHAGVDGAGFVCNRRGLENTDKAMRAHFATLTPERVPAFILELLVGGWVKHSGIEAPGFVSLCKAYKVDLKAVALRMKASAGEKKPKKKKPEARGQSEEPVRSRILKLAEPRGMDEKALNVVASRVLGKPEDEHPWLEARGGELTAILAAVDELSEYDPDEGWIPGEDTLVMCPRCGTNWPQFQRPERLKCGKCGYEGAVPELGVDDSKRIEFTAKKGTAGVRVQEVEKGGWICAIEYSFRVGNMSGYGEPFRDDEEERRATEREAFSRGCERLLARLKKLPGSSCFNDAQGKANADLIAQMERFVAGCEAAVLREKEAADVE